MRELQDRGRRRFRTERSCFGRTFRQPATRIKANHLILILSGEVSITKDSKEETRVRAGEFIFIPLSSHYTGTVIQPGTYISLSFFHDTISLCDKHMLSSYLDKIQTTPPALRTAFRACPSGHVPASAGVLSPGGRQLQAPARTQGARVVHHLPHSLHKERNNPTPLPYNGNRGRLQGSRSPTQRPGAQQTRTQVAGMSGSELHRKFTQEFGETVEFLATETKKQGNTIPAQLRFHLYKRGGIRVGLSSAAGFNKYCKNNFGCSPSELKQEIKKKQQNTDIQRFAILDNRLVNLDN